MATQSKISSRELTALSDTQLSALRFCDFDWSAPLPPRYARVLSTFRSECDARGLAIRPEIYWAKEWLCPEGSVAIGVPFYLCHPRLTQFERKFKGAAEGETPAEFLSLLRHEMGHCFDHAYGISERRDFVRLFGSPEKDYMPDFYVPDPAARTHVQHLPGHYAQSHPLEDFAETFAICLDASSNWERTYADRPAVLKKLFYIKELWHKHVDRPPRFSAPRLLDVRRSVLTLRAHYKRQTALMAKLERYVNLDR